LQQRQKEEHTHKKEFERKTEKTAQEENIGGGRRKPTHPQ